MFCHVDAFCHTLLPQWDQALRPLDKEGGVVLALGPSDVVTIMPHFHQVRFRDYKTYYPVCSS